MVLQVVVDVMLAGHRVVSSTATVHLTEALRAMIDHALLDVVIGSFKFCEVGDKGCLIVIMLTLLLSRWLSTGLLLFRPTPVSDHMLTL